MGTTRRPLDDFVSNLPISDILPDINQTLQTHQNMVLQAQTGAGKTTVVPLEFLRRGFATGRVLVLQPRRIAAIGAARRMAELWGDSLGDTIGYRIRHASVCSRGARIEVITEGILVRMLQWSPTLDGVCCVFFDEFHERSLDLDLSFTLCLHVQRTRRRDLRLIVMSATLAKLGEQVARLLGDCPQIFSEGRMYPVEVEHVCWREELETAQAIRVQRLEHMTAAIISRALSEHEGDILAFLPGEKEIMHTWIFLNNDYHIGDGNIPRTMAGWCKAQVQQGAADLTRNISVMVLYSNLDQEEQDEVLAPPAKGGRKVILTTNIAESSITVPGIRIVIDCGMHRTQQFVPATNMSYLRTIPISKASADQRKGRAGRVAEGVCYRMWHEYEHRVLEDNDQPAILHVDLAPFVLDLASIGVCSDEEIASLPWLDAPSFRHVHHARELLERMHAFDCRDGRWSLLPRGRYIVRLPVHPRASHVICQLRAKSGWRSTAVACTLVALMDAKDPLRGGRKEHGVDILARYEALRHGSPNLIRSVQESVAKTSGQLLQILGVDPRGADKHVSPDRELWGLMVAWAYPELVARKVMGHTDRPRSQSQFVTYKLTNGSTAKMDSTDKLGQCDWIAVSAVDGDKILWACELDPAYCQKFGLDVRAPAEHEIFEADFSGDLGEQPCAPPCFVQVEATDPAELRRDPQNGATYAFQEFERLCADSYSPAEIRIYWRNECVPVSAEQSPGSVPAPHGDPAAGAPAAPAQSGTRPAEETRVDPEDGFAYTLAQLKKFCSGKYTEAEIVDYWNTSCHRLGASGESPQGPASRVTFASTTLGGAAAGWRGAVGSAVEGRKALARCVAGLSIEQWLTTIDETGSLLQYRDVLTENYDTVVQIVGVYASPGPNGAWGLSTSFFEDVGVCKVAHTKMFERWFATAARG